MTETPFRMGWNALSFSGDLCVIKFNVPGRPIQKGNVVSNPAGGAYWREGPRLSAWSEQIAYAAEEARRKATFVLFWEEGWHQCALKSAPDEFTYAPKGTAIQIEAIFYFNRPKSDGNKKPPMVKRPDLDKLQRGILDAMQKVIYDDDSQVVGIHAHKRYADEEGRGEGVDIRVCIDLSAKDVSAVLDQARAHGEREILWG